MFNPRPSQPNIPINPHNLVPNEDVDERESQQQRILEVTYLPREREISMYQLLMTSYIHIYVAFGS